SPDHALLVHEHGNTLCITGTIALRGSLTDMSLGDPAYRPLSRPKGLLVDISGPGDLRVSEHYMHRLQAGFLHQETSFSYDEWFRAWYDEAADELFGLEP